MENKTEKNLKYNKALEIDSEFTHLCEEELFQHLEDRGYCWDIYLYRWLYIPGLINIRILCDQNQVGKIADKVTKALANMGLYLVEASRSYPCHPPDAKKSRICLTFRPETPKPN